MWTKLAVATLCAGFFNLVCAQTSAGDALTEGIAPRYQSPAGTPDLTKPVFLKRGSYVCNRPKALFAIQQLIMQADRTGRDRAELLRQFGCATATADLHVAVEQVRDDPEEALRESMFHYVGIFWRNSNGTVWNGWTRVANLRN